MELTMKRFLFPAAAVVLSAALTLPPVLAAERDGALLGFGSVGPDGYLDLLYVRPERQGQGLGAALCDALEGLYPVGRLTVHASRTARPFSSSTTA